MRRSKDRYGADVGETGSGEPGARTALRARSNDVDLIHELPYGPAACEPPQQRPDTWQHPIPRRSCSKILLAPEGASTHASENDIRACVTKRKISGGTMSEAGRNARDVMLGLMKTCRKLGVSFFVYLGDRLGLNPSSPTIPPLAHLVSAAA